MTCCTVGYRAPVACDVAEITYRQLDYWARTDLVEPSIRSGFGSGSQRLYCYHDLLFLRTVRRLLDCSLSVQSARAAIDVLRASDPADLDRLTLLTSGSDVYALVGAEQVAVLLQEGRPVFAVSMRALCEDVRSRLEGRVGESALFGAVG